MRDQGPFSPLSPPVYNVLITLGKRTMHGYGIIVEFEKRTGQEGALLPGSLYNTMARMLKANLLEEVDSPEESSDGRKRYYRATELGLNVARSESQRLRSLLALAQEQRLIGDPPTLP